MNKTYLITLEPLSTFYFGSERNFEGGQSYFARSLQFPQQTTLLGAMRFKLLQSRDLMDSSGQIVDYSRAESLIGPNSFTADKCAEPKDYGVVKGLSHLFLLRGDEIFCPGNLDYHCTFVRDEEGRSFTDEARRFIPALKGYDPKNPDRPRMVSSKGNSVLSDDIFLEVEQVGNRKTKPRFLTSASRRPDDDEKGFYKQIFYRFAKPSMPGEPPWRFAFLAVMEEADGDQLARYTVGQQRVTPIGGERSPFNFEVYECPAEVLAQFSARIYYSTSSVHPLTKAVLLSDAFTDQPLYECCDFAVTDSTDFRYLETSVKATKHYHRVSDRGGDSSIVRKIAKKINLLQRGSVFYISEGKIEDFMKTIEAPKAFRQIGFNSYVLVNSKTEFHSWITG